MEKEEELDVRYHPKVTIRRKLLGMDFNAGAFLVFGVVLCVVFSGRAVSTNHSVIGLLGGAVSLLACFQFARKFLNNRPKSYFNDWVQSRSTPNYFPKRYQPRNNK